MRDGVRVVMRAAGAMLLGVALLAGCGAVASGASAGNGGSVQEAMATASQVRIPNATAAASPVPIPQGSKVVTIDNFSFVPQTLTVPVGSSVSWVNHDDIPHLVVSSDKTFLSQALDTDDHYTFRFTQRGSYGYFCGLHPKMTGTIIVQ